MADRFKAGEEVRLTEAFDGLDAGSPGRIVGRYARERESYVVKFYQDDVQDVPPELLESVNED